MMVAPLTAGSNNRERISGKLDPYVLAREPEHEDPVDPERRGHCGSGREVARARQDFGLRILPASFRSQLHLYTAE